MRAACRVALIASMLSVACLAASAPKKARDWNHVDWSKAERDLEDGDDEELLRTEEAIAIEELQKRKQAAAMLPDESVKLKEPAEWMKHHQAMSGPTMLFATLNPVTKQGEPWTKDTLGKLSFEWRELLHTAGIEATCYDIGDVAKGDYRILVTCQSGWRGYEVRDFLLQRPELVELEWDQVKYHPGDELIPAANVGADRVRVPGMVFDTPSKKKAPGGGKGKPAAKGKAPPKKAKRSATPPPPAPATPPPAPAGADEL